MFAVVLRSASPLWSRAEDQPGTMPVTLHAAPPARASAGCRGERAEPRLRPCQRRASVRCAAAQEGSGLLPLDHSVPTAGFASVPSALAAIANGELVIVMDDEDRENEGDLICAADKCSTETLAFMVRYTSGVVCVAMEEERLNALGLPQMVESKARGSGSERERAGPAATLHRPPRFMAHAPARPLCHARRTRRSCAPRSVSRAT